MASWQGRHDAAELNAIADALSVLHNFGYFESQEVELMARLQYSLVGVDDAVGLQLMRDHRANTTYLNRLKAEAIDLVKTYTNSDSQGDEN